MHAKPPVAHDGRLRNSFRSPRSEKSAQRSHSSIRSPRSSDGAGRLRTPSNLPQCSPYLQPVKLQARTREPLDIRNLHQSEHVSYPASQVVVATLERRPETAPPGSPLTGEQTSHTLEGISTSDSSSLHDANHPLGIGQPDWEEEGDSGPPTRYVSLDLQGFSLESNVACM